MLHDTFHLKGNIQLSCLHFRARHRIDTKSLSFPHIDYKT